MSTFLEDYYNIIVSETDFTYTQNSVNASSYHYSIPKYHGSTEKLKEIHQNFKKMHSNDTSDLKKVLDTTVYSEHWFRCPNQYKGNGVEKNIHIIKKGVMSDFIIDYIPENSINIDHHNMVEFGVVEAPKCKPSTKQQSLVVHDNDKQLIFSKCLEQPVLYRKIFDECYKQTRFDVYEYWIKIGMALKNTFNNEVDAFELFDYYSSKGIKYEGREKTYIKFNTFVKRQDGLTIGTIYIYAMEDNKHKFIEIMNRNTFELEQSDICKYLKTLAGYKFIYKKTGNIYQLYCYNGRYWEQDDVLLRSFISNELYEFLKTILTEVYWESKDFSKMKLQLNRLKTIKYKKELIESYKENGCSQEIEFDNKWHLLGFNNLVYDLHIGGFREYQ